MLAIFHVSLYYFNDIVGIYEYNTWYILFLSNTFLALMAYYVYLNKIITALKSHVNHW